MDYNAKTIESKWQKYWIKHGLFEPENENSKKEKKYILSMFPYPSGKIHMGHVRNYCLGDAFARYYRKNNYNVLHPIGWDSFGMPAENAAIKNKTHPKKWTYENIDYMRNELSSLGISYSKTREFATSDPQYTKWEQEFILKLFEEGILYKKSTIVNWCEPCHTVLANEQVEDGKCWRCENDVEQKEMPGYYIAITKFATQLLDDLKTLENKWPSKVLTMQKNWIGRSEGLEFDLLLSDNSNKKLEHNFEKFSVFTTRPDTIFGITYAALAPEHKMVDYLIEHKLLSDDKINLIKSMKKVSVKNRSIEEKRGVDLNITVVHPITKAEIPVWVANFVLMDYGQGAVMSVPAHDQRDFEFAKKYDLDIKVSIESYNKTTQLNEAFLGDGLLVNSGEFNGLKTKDAKIKIMDFFEANKLGTRKINFKLRDWGVSRQRYWGAPIPLINCLKCGVVPQHKKNLPVTLPDDIELTGEGNPLDNHKTWKNIQCPKCGNDAYKETDTLDTFVQSSWYFLRYATNPDKWGKEAISKKDTNYWMNVDQYIGGIEHAILHLLYARFFTKVLKKFDYISSDEPFEKLLTQGMVLKDGFKMSKSKGNVVDTDSIISQYGADTARLFVMFAAPPAKELEWNDDAVKGSHRFIKKLYENSKFSKISDETLLDNINHDILTIEEKEARVKIYEALKKSNEVMNKTSALNTLIASCMECFNALQKQKNTTIWSEGYYILLNVLEPIIPHVAWELSEKLFKLRNLKKQLTIKKEVFIVDKITLAITVNGKKRDEIRVDLGSTNEEILLLAKTKTNVIKWIEGKEIIREIIVPNKLVNLVVK